MMFFALAWVLGGFFQRKKTNNDEAHSQKSMGKKSFNSHTKQPEYTHEPSELTCTLTLSSITQDIETIVLTIISLDNSVKIGAHESAFTRA
jgi:hypothetical protein